MRSKRVLFIASEREENTRLADTVRASMPDAKITVSSTATALGMLKAEAYDLALLVVDESFTEAGSLALIKELFLHSPDVPLLSVLSPGEDLTILRALRDGITTFVSREDLSSPRFTRAVAVALNRGEHKVAVPAHSGRATNRFGLPLSQSDGEQFRDLRDRYTLLLKKSLDRQSYRGESDGSGMEEMARQLGELGAGPRDVIDLHSSVMKTIYDPEKPSKQYAYAQEARLLLLELMGYLVGFYRGVAFGTPVPHVREVAGDA